MHIWAKTQAHLARPAGVKTICRTCVVGGCGKEAEASPLSHRSGQKRLLQAQHTDLRPPLSVPDLVLILQVDNEIIAPRQDPNQLATIRCRNLGGRRHLLLGLQDSTVKRRLSKL